MANSTGVAVKKAIIELAPSIGGTFRADDGYVVVVTLLITIMGRLCSGFIPIIALAVGVYQLRIQISRFKRERKI